MAFRIRDLMIDVPTAVPTYYTACGYPSVLCHYPTVVACFNQSCYGISYQGCPFGSIPTTILTQVCTFTEQPTGPGPIDLGSLKQQLRAQLAQVEEQERIAEAASRPQTREQATELEEKLRAALEEVRTLKKNLPAAG